MNRHPARDFRHRREKRQRPLAIRDRLVGDARHFAFDQLFRQLDIGREMQVSEQQLALAHSRILGRDRLFHFDDHLALSPHVVSRVDDRRARRLIQLIREA
jgi:hypothetical protein